MRRTQDMFPNARITQAYGQTELSPLATFLTQEYHLGPGKLRPAGRAIPGIENVYSAEVENALAQHAAVLECAVIGVPDERWGERVHAVVRFRPGTTATD
jgi:acyl-CoA synthetase (AMP-forming)/AMP-acid ligase II